MSLSLFLWLIGSLLIDLQTSSSQGVGTCFLSSFQLPNVDTNAVQRDNPQRPLSPSKSTQLVFSPQDEQQQIRISEPRPPTKGSSGNRDLRPATNPPAPTTTTLPPIVPKPTTNPRVIYLRPASRRRSRPLATPTVSPVFRLFDQFGEDMNLVNHEELEAIAMFETALDRAKKDFGSRLRGRNPPQNQPRRQKPSFNPDPDFFDLTFRAADQERITDQQEELPPPPPPPPTHRSTKGKTGNRRVQPPPPPPPPEEFQQKEVHLTTTTTTTTTTRAPFVVPRGKTSQRGFEPPSQRKEPEHSKGGGERRQQFGSKGQFVGDSPKTDLFLSWMNRAKMLSNMQLAPGTNFTVLLPSDQSINSLPSKFQSDLNSNMTRMREVLFYHVIPASIESLLLEDGESIPTLYYKDIRVSRGPVLNDPFIMMSGSKILNERRDLMLANGKIRFFNVDRVLFPPRGSLYSVISTSPSLTLFSRLLDQTSMRSELALSGPFTVFAPSNDAFNRMDSETLDFITRDERNAKEFLMRHIIQSPPEPLLFTSAIPERNSILIHNRMGDNMNVVRTAADLVEIDDARISFADILATNGVLHVVEDILFNI